jgi:Protein of unknown function (DUF2934)
MATPAELAAHKPVEPVLGHEVQIRGYELYEQRGKRDGLALDDWLKAEAEVRAHVEAHS